MPDLRGNTVWVAASFLLAILLAAVMAGVAQLVSTSRCEEERQRTPWRAMGMAAILAGLLAAGMGVAAESVVAAVAGAALGTRFVWRHDFRGRPQHVALRGRRGLCRGIYRRVDICCFGDGLVHVARLAYCARGRASGYGRGQSDGDPALHLDGLWLRDRTRATVRAGRAARNEPAHDRLGRPSDDEHRRGPWTLCVSHGVESAFDGSLRRCTAPRRTQCAGRLRVA